MIRSRHLSHKLLLVLLLLVLFCVPFLMAGVHAGSDPAALRAGAGVLSGADPATQTSTPTTYAAQLGATAGNELHRTATH